MRKMGIIMECLAYHISERPMTAKDAAIYLKVSEKYARDTLERLRERGLVRTLSSGKFVKA